ncbi:FIST signal transduction protein [Piscinibacter sakaiensis]|uniref:FIST signal transduction protein n=1 Tax=Piscinibacter sakaiensis TaxID=1547922 RepID=UPI003AAE0B70
MKLFLHGHASDPDWRVALNLAAAQVDAQRQAEHHATQLTLGWVYLTDHHAASADALLAELGERWPGVAWVGAVGVGVAANGVEYFDEPGLVLMLGDIPAEDFRIYSGAEPLSGGGTADFEAATAQIHADPATPDLDELITEMADRTATGYLFGGLASSRGRHLHIANGVFEGGLSGVAFSRKVALLSRVTQGCQPAGPVRRISAAERNLVIALDGEPALDCLLRDLQIEGAEPREALPRLRGTLVGISDRSDDVVIRPGQFGTDTRVRHLIGIDPNRRAIAIGDNAEVDMQLAFCSRNTEAARRDLVRICSEIREELEPEELPLETALALQASDGERGLHPARRIAGAIYVSCSGRGGPHFGAPSAELAVVRHALGDVPLVGFFAAGEIARHHLYGYTGVLTVFTC